MSSGCQTASKAGRNQCDNRKGSALGVVLQTMLVILVAITSNSDLHAASEIL